MTFKYNIILDQPVAIIDIGSNSIRLAVFERAARCLQTTFNEKVLCGLGRNVASTGELSVESTTRALSALGRFRLILNEMEVGAPIAFATAAVRNASNGSEFIRLAEDICGVQIQVLSGLDEAKFAVKGVVYGNPKSTGLVGDLGGGSLELSYIENGKVKNGETLQIGALALMDMSDSQIEPATKIVDDALKAVKWLKNLPERRLFAVGGAWRTLARIHMSEDDYGLRILQHYTIPSSDFLDLVSLITHASRKTLERMPDVPSRRIDSLPFSALVMERLLNHAKIKETVISAYGVREGIVFDALPDIEKAKDPVTEGLRNLSERFGRVRPMNAEIQNWTSVFLEGSVLDESDRQIFLRDRAATLFDIAWEDHPDHRASIAFEQIVFANIAGITHYERLYIAHIVFYRYTYSGKPVLPGHGLELSEDDLMRSRVIGSLMRLGLTLSGGVGHILPQTSLQIEGCNLVLSLPHHFRDLNGEVVEKRLKSLASSLRELNYSDLDNVEIVVADVS